MAEVSSVAAEEILHKRHGSLRSEPQVKLAVGGG